MGSTPELRDLFYKLKVGVTLIDMNLEMILAMSEITKYKNSEEIIICCNWVKTPLANNYFDAVLGDIVLANVPPELQNKFLKEVKRILKPKGLFITKDAVVPRNWQFIKIDDVLKNMRIFLITIMSQ